MNLEEHIASIFIIWGVILFALFTVLAIWDAYQIKKSQREYDEACDEEREQYHNSGW